MCVCFLAHSVYIHTYIHTHTHTHIYIYIYIHIQSEQLAIVKALYLINYLEIADNKPRTIGVYTDSRITIDSLKKASNHNYLIEEIRNRLINLRSAKWTIEFSWIKARAGNLGNELADRLAKDAASDKDIPVVFDRISKTTLYSELEEEAKLK